MPFHIVLLEPEIPNNTGNIGRLCLALGATLHLVHPLGFEITDQKLKRSGLDYWKHLNVIHHDSKDAFFKHLGSSPFALFSSHGTKTYWELPFQKDMYLIFGKESVGLPKELLAEKRDQVYTIPLHSNHIRSINLANAVAVVGYEGIKQLNLAQ